VLFIKRQKSLAGFPGIKKCVLIHLSFQMCYLGIDARISLSRLNEEIPIFFLPKTGEKTPEWQVLSVFVRELFKKPFYTKVKVVLRFSDFKNSPKSSLKREDLKVESQNHFVRSIILKTKSTILLNFIVLLTNENKATPWFWESGGRVFNHF